MEKLLPIVEASTTNLAAALRAWHRRQAGLEIVADSAKTFVYATGRLVVLARMTDSERRYSQEVFDLVEETHGTCRFLDSYLRPEEGESQARPSFDGRVRLGGGGHLKSSSAGSR